MRRRRCSVLRAVCVIAIAVIPFWGGVDGVAASSAITHAEIYSKVWSPPLPVVPNTFIVEESRLAPYGRHIQFLRPGEHFLVLIVNPAKITVAPSTFQQEAYDVDDGRCDLVSLQTYHRLFDRVPEDHEFWRVEEHRSSASSAENGAERVGDQQDQSMSVKSLLFIAPSTSHLHDDTEEFCVIAKENKTSTNRQVSMIIVVRSAAQQVLTLTTLAATVSASAIGLLSSLTSF